MWFFINWSSSCITCSIPPPRLFIPLVLLSALFPRCLSFWSLLLGVSLTAEPLPRRATHSSSVTLFCFISCQLNHVPLLTGGECFHSPLCLLLSRSFIWCFLLFNLCGVPLDQSKPKALPCSDWSQRVLQKSLTHSDKKKHLKVILRWNIWGWKITLAQVVEQLLHWLKGWWFNSQQLQLTCQSILEPKSTCGH